MDFECKLVTATSKKTGNPYTAIDITLAPGYVKRVFLTHAEVALVQIQGVSHQ